MRSSYPKKEDVLRIDSGDYMGRIIFPSYSADAKIYQNVETVVVGAINGNMDPLVKAYDGVDRNANYVYVNITRITGFKKESLDVPSDITALVDEYNNLFPKYRENQRDDKELDVELLNNVTTLSRRLNEYFER